MFAGCWDTWQPPEGGPVRSCTIITTEANVLMSSIHHRMPVILDPEAATEWLDPKTPTAELQHLLRACPDLWLEAHPA